MERKRGAKFLSQNGNNPCDFIRCPKCAITTAVDHSLLIYCPSSHGSKLLETLLQLFSAAVALILQPSPLLLCWLNSLAPSSLSSYRPRSTDCFERLTSVLNIYCPVCLVKLV